MQLLNTKYSIHPENYVKRTPVWLKIIADILLGISAIAEVSLPDFPGKDWVVFGCICLKFVSKTITEELTKV